MKSFIIKIFLLKVITVIYKNLVSHLKLDVAHFHVGVGRKQEEKPRGSSSPSVGRAQSKPGA